jgi:pyrimidine-nucleoside phosphorylase
VEKFREVIQQQGGDPRVVDDYSRMPAAPHREVVRAARAGFVHGFEAERVGRAAVLLGAGRDRVEDSVDPAVGSVVLVDRGAPVKTGDPLLELHYRDRSRLQAALALLQNACSIQDNKPASEPIVLETVRGN